MAGYSGTPLAKKIGVKPGLEVLLRNAPGDWSIPGVASGKVDVKEADIVVAFYRSRSELERDVAKMPTQLAKTAMWWVVWPRKAGGHTSDITENLLRELILPTGLVDVKVAALDDDWSGLKFVWRKELR
ncbi:MAG TPA: DUF3052 domain-containing protein [Micromonosporaceae bacterium]|nr:DUF3052 domain-containing protein [Micromonosporaceae bacterium]